jgi:hypothetical protein
MIKNRYDGYYKGEEGCPWHIHAHIEQCGGDIVIVMIFLN